MGLRYAEDLGGSNMDFLATAVLAEELAKGDSIGTAVSLMAQSEFALAILADEASDDVAGFSIGAGTSEIMRELISRSLVASQTHKETR